MTFVITAGWEDDGVGKLVSEQPDAASCHAGSERSEADA
jgi:hypothetical protein